MSPNLSSFARRLFEILANLVTFLAAFLTMNYMNFDFGNCLATEYANIYNTSLLKNT